MMSNRKTRMLAILLCGSLAGLTVVLAVLLQSAWRSKQQAVQRNARTAVAQAVRDLEAREIAGQTRRFLVSEAFDDSILLPPGDLGTWTAEHEREMFVDADSLSIVRFHTTFNATAGTSTESSRLDTVVVDTGQPNRALALVLKGERAQMVEKLVGDVVHLRPRPIAERLTREDLSDALRSQLAAVDITAQPRFAVIDAATEDVVMANVADPSALVDGALFRSRLFPLDLAPPHYDLAVDLSGTRSMVLARVWPLGLASAVFLLVTALAFVHAIRTIGRQRRHAGHVVAFINNMTHEFKTPLATVSLACEALERRDTDPDRRRYLEMIRGENARMGRQVEQILELAHLERGELRRGTSSVDISALVARSAAAFRLQAAGRGGDLTVRGPDRTARIRGDEMHLAAIVDNLLDNAVKYSPGAPRIVVTAALRGADFALSVEDHGPGIAPADQARVFEPYFRCSTGNRHDVKGHGLGLSYVRHLVALHGGEVELRSRPGRGTTVQVRLPLDPAPEGGR